MSTLTQEEQEKLSEFLTTRKLCVGLGNLNTACSIGTINLFLSNTLTARIPKCMSEVIGKWIVYMQDLMPAELINSSRWKQLLVLAAGTGREKEKERFAIIEEWFWTTVLPCFTYPADEFTARTDQQEPITISAEQVFLVFDEAIAGLKSATYSSNNAILALHKLIWLLHAFIEHNNDSTDNKIASILCISKLLKFAVNLQDKDVVIEDMWKVFAPCELLEKLVNV